MNSLTTQEEHNIYALDWMHPSPFVSLWAIDATDIDHYQHTNNIAYLSRLEQLAWEHSASLELTFAHYEALDRAMAITQHELNYHYPSHLGDTLACATWIATCDNKFRLSRQFQYINPTNGKTIFTAKTHFVCISLKTGQPKKMPIEFTRKYGHVALT